jgi:hypothetical protein
MLPDASRKTFTSTIWDLGSSETGGNSGHPAEVGLLVQLRKKTERTVKNAKHFRKSIELALVN